MVVARRFTGQNRVSERVAQAARDGADVLVSLAARPLGRYRRAIDETLQRHGIG